MSARTARRVPWQPVVGILAIALLVLSLRGLTGDPTYTAVFAHASGVRVGEEVRVAGIAVGEVTSVQLDRKQVVVEFTAGDGAELTEDSRAAVKLASTLGTHYLEVRPGSGRPLEDGGRIPLASTESALTLDEFWVEGTRTVEELDLDALADAVDVMAEELNGDPDVTAAALDGVAQVSAMVTRRDQQVGRLLQSTRAVTETVVDQQDELLTLLDDADLVLQMVTERRRQIEALLANTQRMVTTVSALVDDNQSALRPMLADLNRVMSVLEDNADELDRTLELVGPQMRYFANASGNGPWVDVYSPNFIFPSTLMCPLTATMECLP